MIKFSNLTLYKSRYSELPDSIVDNERKIASDHVFCMIEEDLGQKMLLNRTSYCFVHVIL